MFRLYTTDAKSYQHLDDAIGDGARSFALTIDFLRRQSFGLVRVAGAKQVPGGGLQVALHLLLERFVHAVESEQFV